MRNILLALLLLLPLSLRAAPWAAQLQQRLEQVDAAHPGELGVYIKDPLTGDSVSLRGEETWYLASGVKLPIAIAVLQAVEAGHLSLVSPVQLTERDYVDGAGRTNAHRPGSRLSVQYLLEEMLIHSDNTASDLLIRQVGLERINQLVQSTVPGGFGTITTLGDVRRHAYSGFHPSAANLASADLLRIKAAGSERQRLATLAAALRLRPQELAMRDWDSAFNAYYSANLNTGRLSAYAALLEALVKGELLEPGSTAYLLDVMAKVETGSRRVKAGLPASVVFAHKTGTQHRRICDLGIILARGFRAGPAVVTVEPSSAATARGPGDSIPLLVASCSRDFISLADAEDALREVGEAIAASAIFATEPGGGAL